MKEIIEKMLKSDDISEFLSVWLENDLLSEDNQKVFEAYYFSYRKHFGKYMRHYYKRQTEELMEIIKKSSKPKVLEIGCGTGIRCGAG